MESWLQLVFGIAVVFLGALIGIGVVFSFNAFKRGRRSSICGGGTQITPDMHYCDNCEKNLRSTAEIPPATENEILPQTYRTDDASRLQDVPPSSPQTANEISPSSSQINHMRIGNKICALLILVGLFAMVLGIWGYIWVYSSNEDPGTIATRYAWIRKLELYYDMTFEERLKMFTIPNRTYLLIGGILSVLSGAIFVQREKGENGTE